MSSQDLRPYITYLSTLKVIVCRFCEGCIPPDTPLRYYKSNYTTKKPHPIPVEIRHRIKEYITTLDLYNPSEVLQLNSLVPELKVIEKGYICNFIRCGACRTSELSMRTHYYFYRKYIPKGFADWKETLV